MLLYSLLFIFLLTGCQSSAVDAKVASAKSQTVIRPSGQKIHHPLIVLDAGHGGHDQGTKDSLGEEKDLNLKTAFYVRNELVKMGYRVMMTRSRDIFIALEQRALFANRHHADLFVSIHYNSAPQKTAQGIEIFYYEKTTPSRRKASKAAANSILSKVIGATGAVNRGLKAGDYCVIRETGVPAILIEGGFMTHDEEGKKIRQTLYQKKLAKAIAEGIDSYFIEALGK